MVDSFLIDPIHEYMRGRLLKNFTDDDRSSIQFFGYGQDDTEEVFDTGNGTEASPFVTCFATADSMSIHKIAKDLLAERAFANAVSSCFPACKIVMCFYHVKANIRKKILSMRAFKSDELVSLFSFQNDKKDSILRKVGDIHYSISEDDFELNLANLNAYLESLGNNGLLLKDYFEKQWTERGQNVFFNWRIFDTPPGYCGTNNSLEVTNRHFKSVYLNNIRQPLIVCLSSFEERLKKDVLSSSGFQKQVQASTTDKSIGCSIFGSNFLLLNTNQLIGTKFRMTHMSLQGLHTYQIFKKELVDENLVEKIEASVIIKCRENVVTDVMCDCKYYWKKGVCCHVLAVGLRNEVVLPSYLPKMKYLFPGGKFKTSIGRPKKNTPALNMN